MYGGKYQSSGALAWLGVIAIASAVSNTFAAVLRAVERPEQVARVYAIAAFTLLSVSVVFVYLAGLAGAIAGVIVANVVCAMAVAMSGIRWGGSRTCSTSHVRG